MKPATSRFWPFALLVLASLLGAVSLALFLLFLIGGPIAGIDLGLGEAGALGMDTALCLAFFVQHSAMIRTAFRRRSEQVIPAPYHGAVYTVASSVVLLLLLVFWQSTGTVFAAAEGVARWLLHGLAAAGAIGTMWGMQSLGAIDGFGGDSIRAHLKGDPLPELPLSVRGPYRWVRHPLYLFMLFFIWSYPQLSTDRLLFNLMFTAWIVIGAVLEERDLVARFGDGYRHYQARVPMLFPRTLRPAWSQ